jgi:hypothetical protein
VPLDYQKLMNWPFAAITRSYNKKDSARFARGFGAGIDPGWQVADHPFLYDEPVMLALPMSAVALADGEFWQQNTETGIVWQQMVHAQESLRVHRPLPAEGTVVVTQKIQDIFDRGPEKGALMVQTQWLSDLLGNPLISIEVTTVLRANGGFGGQPQPVVPRDQIPQRPADCSIEIRTPEGAGTPFQLSADIAIAGQADTNRQQYMLRGVGCFGLAGRGALRLACDNDPNRLRAIGVRYAGPMFTGETMRLDLWHVRTGQAVFNMHACERNAPVLSHGFIEFAVSDQNQG